MPDHNHSHSNNGASSSQRSLILALILTTAFAVVEAMAGWLSGSLALLSDAGHMFTDSAALAIGALSAWLSKRPPSARHSYGWKRAEILGALINALLMVGIVIAIAITAIDRLRTPHAIDGTIIMLVAAIGLIINVGAAWILHRGEQNLNVRGAWLHVMGDLLGSVAALVAGIVIWLTGWTPIDALLSLFISALILLSSFRLLNDVTRVLMEGVPKNIDLPEVGR
ncbi:MAG: cation diffusion facilitator family transporter, partial [Gammaproteobacteria bacterium]